MKITLYYNIFISLLKTAGVLCLLFSALLISSCENNMTTIQQLTAHDSLPQQSITQAEITYTENGDIKAILTSPIIDQYTNISEPCMKFPTGVEILFYDSLQKVSGKIQAEYAIRYNQKQLIVAKKNVHIFDYAKNRELITEILYWDQKKKYIYNYDFTTLKDESQVMYGDSLSLTEDMNQLEMKQIRATLDYKEAHL